MSSKRNATSQLDHEWNGEDDEPEKPGDFQKASDAELRGRVIKTARRRIAQSTESESTGVFTGFSGFSNVPKPATDGASPFAFLAKLPSANGTQTSTVPDGEPKKQTQDIAKDKVATTSPRPLTGNVSTPTTDKTQSEDYQYKIKSLNLAVSAWIKEQVDKQPVCILTPIFKDYEKHLEEIDTAEDTKSGKSSIPVSEAVGAKSFMPKTAADTAASPKTPTMFSFGSAKSSADTVKPTTAPPTFSFGVPKMSADEAAPKTFLFCASSKSTSGELTKEKPTFSFGIPKTATPSNDPSKTPSFSFGAMKPKDGGDESPKKSTFSFGIPKTSNTADDASGKSPATTFSFGSKPTGATVPMSGFQFSSGSTDTTNTTDSSTIVSPKSSIFASSSAGFTFGSSTPTTFGSSVVAKPIDDAAAEEDEPPKVEFTPVVEENSLYTKRCKVFVKVAGNYADRGVGTLYIKTADGSDKKQMLVRADTNLGNILLNILLTEAIRGQRLGVNNVVIPCLPTPESKPPPTSVLLRVKSKEDADELLATIEKFKK